MGLLDSLKSYTASDKGVSLRSKDAVEEEVLQRTQALAVESRAESRALPTATRAPQLPRLPLSLDSSLRNHSPLL